ncbi:hypothetical protein [Escherichia coli]|uniref:hypothetical protein n=1 Tax=Escherichia coli TaxID=562 RepID=UPI000C24D80C|nr:hypothetical protein [Escherichia coli]PJI60774.1 hypothetical protein CTU84_01240 [Escherichia coli]PJI65330.1 hypothetical protein CTY41_00730 [Escherichia coli]
MPDVFGLSHLPGFKGKSGKKSKNTSAAAVHLKPSVRNNAKSRNKEEKKVKMSFLHLNNGGKAGADDSGDTINQPDIPDISDVKGAESLFRSNEPEPLPKKHTREHNVSISEEAKSNPVLALRLLRTTDLKSSAIIKELRNSPEAITAFTERYMTENSPEWEFVSDEDKARQAMIYSMGNDDSNGYSSGKTAARKVLDGMRDNYITQAEFDRSLALYRENDPEVRRAEVKKLREEYARTAAREHVRYHQALKKIGQKVSPDDLDEDKVYETMKQRYAI